jgi:transposase
MKRQSTNLVNARHARIILLSRGGLSNRQIGEQVDCTAAWVRKILHRFNAGGIEAITWCPYSCARGGPYKFTADLVEQIAEVALSPPKTLIGMNCWSLSKLRAYLIEQKIVGSISLSWLRTLLRRCKVRLRRTKTWKDSKDPTFWAKYRAIRRLYKKAPRNGRVICVDEFGPLNLQPRGGTCLAGCGKGVERHRATYHRTGGVRHLFGAYDLKTDRLVGTFSEKKNWTTFLTFLRWLRRRYSRNQTLYIILDQAGYHRKQEVLDWAAEHNVCFSFTPTNASWLNRIESHFTALRKFTLDNSDFRTHEEQQQAIERYLDWRNRRRRISLEAWHAYKRKTKRHAA